MNDDVSRGTYRPDIDGLRAVAVLSVILFHADLPWMKGGFTGVDVFFVISGYLITGIVQRQLVAGTFSFRRFYERRARRILPALLVVIAFTLGACALLMLPADLPAVGRSAVAVLLFSANIVFWRGVDFGDLTTVNYFGRQIHEQPLVHTWSLGVEEQFYVLFPITLFILWRLSKSLVVPALAAALIASLALCIWLTPNSPGVAFYLLPPRGWELLAGGLLAVIGSPRRMAMRVGNEIAAALGLALILSGVAMFSSTTPFPGTAAIVPVLGSALLLHFAPGSRVGTWLSWRPLVFVGLISYSAYLWHQPLFAFARYVNLDGQLDRRIASVLIVVTIGLASLTWRFVETPFRNARVVSVRRLLWSLALAIIVVAVPSSMIAFGSSAGRKSPVASNLVGQSLISLFADCSPLSSMHALGPGCLTDPSSDAKLSFLVIGDSHAEALFPAFFQISRDSGLQGRLIGLNACSPLLEISDVPTSRQVCIEMRERALQLVADERIRTVFLVSRFSFAYSPMTTFESRLARTIDAYAQRGAVVNLVSQAPEQPNFQRRYYLQALLRQRVFGRDADRAVKDMTATRAEHEQQQAFVRAAFARYRDDPRVRLIDFTDVLCNAASCAPASATEPYYTDEHHLSPAGARLVSGEIARQSTLSRHQQN